jgi:hypothetical protein
MRLFPSLSAPFMPSSAANSIIAVSARVVTALMLPSTSTPCFLLPLNTTAGIGIKATKTMTPSVTNTFCRMDGAFCVSKPVRWFRQPKTFGMQLIVSAMASASLKSPCRIGRIRRRNNPPLCEANHRRADVRSFPR